MQPFTFIFLLHLLLQPVLYTHQHMLGAAKVYCDNFIFTITLMGGCWVCPHFFQMAMGRLKKVIFSPLESCKNIFYFFLILDHFLSTFCPKKSCKHTASRTMWRISCTMWRVSRTAWHVGHIRCSWKKNDDWHPLTSPLPPKSDKNHFFLKPSLFLHE